MKRNVLFLFLFTLLFTLSGCGILQNLIGDSIVFGTGTLEDGITEKKNEFYPGEDFLLEANFKKAAGSSDIQFITLQLINGDEYFYEEWYDTVDPSWNSLIYEFHDAYYDGIYDEGDYILRIYNSANDLLGEGQFSVYE